MTNSVAFAASFVEPGGSPIRELFPYVSRPGMISFAGGYPSPGLLDAVGLEEACQRVWARGAGLLQYGATEGDPALRQALSALCTARGIQATAEQVLVTTGSQQAFDLLVRVYVEPGDVVYLETPAYPAAIQALRLAGASIVAVPVDAQGLDTGRLETLLQSGDAAARPKMIYTVPSFSNPCGTLLTQARREHLVRLACDYGFLIVEDDPYGELRFADTDTEPVYAIAARTAGVPNPVLYLSSLSKTVAPALRVGWMLARPEVLRRCAIAKQTSDLCTSPIAQGIAAEYLQSGRYPAAVERARAEYARRMQTMSAALTQQLGGRISAQTPQGGMFMWATIDPAIDPQALFRAAVEAGVIYVPGSAFYATDAEVATMRLSYAAPDVAQILEGVLRLGRAMAAQ